MPPPVRRLNLRLCPIVPERDDAAALLAELRAAGLCADNVVRGGAAELRAVERDTVTFLSCGQGGFRYLCPDQGRPVPGFPGALGAWRSGGPREVGCPCGRTHDLAELCYVPDAAFARSWIDVTGAATDELVPEALARARARWGEIRVVRHRG